MHETVERKNNSKVSGLNTAPTASAAELDVHSPYAYDEAGRLESISHAKSEITAGETWDGTSTLPTSLQGGALLAGYFLEYDQENQLTSWSSYADAFETTFSYDVRDQLTGATHAQISGLTLPRALPSSESYDFDGTGNRELSGTSTSTDGSHNQVQNDGTYTYAYDAEGNQTSRTEITSGEVTEYEFDYRNRLVRVTERASAAGAATSLVEFHYDAFDRRTGKELDSDGDGDVERATAWAWDGNQVVLQYADADGDGAADWKLTHRYLYGEAIDQILADEQLPGDGIEITAATLTTGEVLWPLTDHLGSIRDLVDSSGVIRQHVVYDSFGNRLSESDYDATGTPIASNHASAVDHLFGYTGREWDADVELQYNRARWYDPTQGRWISQDPIGFAAGDVNLYRYVGNGTTDSTDPSGQSKSKVIGWVVRRVGGNLVKVSAVYTEKQAAQAFAGKCGKYGFDLLMREGRGSAEKVARIIQARFGKRATGEVLGGGTHLGHPIKNAIGESIGTGSRHIQLDNIANRHIFYGGLAAALGIFATNDAVAGDYSLDLTEIYGDPRPGESFANVFRVGWWCGDDSTAAYLDWINPGELLAMGGDFGRHLDREWNKELIGYLITIRDENGQPLATIAIGPDGEPISHTPWNDGEAGTPVR